MDKKPGDYLLRRLGGRNYTRLGDGCETLVEVFCISTCGDCGDFISLDSIILKESDDRLFEAGICRTVKPRAGYRLGPHEPPRCLECHRKWLDPYKALRAGEVGEIQKLHPLRFGRLSNV